jgi:hypothetical protein
MALFLKARSASVSSDTGGTRIAAGLLTTMLFFVVSCSSQQATTGFPIYRLDGFAAPFASSSGISTKRLLISRNTGEWRKVWGELHANRNQAPPLPAVDFNSMIAVTYSIGKQPSGGFSVEITSVVRSEGSLRLNVEIRRPSPSCIVTSAVTSPADVILLEKAEQSIVVKESSVIVEC